MPNWVILVVESFVFIATVIVIVLVKHFLPSYIEQKGKNYATKEDVQEITKLTESIQQEFRKEIERFKLDLDYKYEFYYKQYEGLYCYLYSIIVQSEYVRQYLKIVRNEEFSFDDAPFIAITPIHRTNQKIEYTEGPGVNYNQKIEEIETPISKFNFEELINFIIEKSALADQKLIKYAVAYRFVHSVRGADADKEEFKEEEERLEKVIIVSIIETFNRLRKELGMGYSENEFETGLFNVERPE